MRRLVAVAVGEKPVASGARVNTDETAADPNIDVYGRDRRSEPMDLGRHGAFVIVNHSAATRGEARQVAAAAAWAPASSLDWRAGRRNEGTRRRESSFASPRAPGSLGYVRLVVGKTASPDGVHRGRTLVRG